MDDQPLRSNLIRLAHANPELRSELLPLLRSKVAAPALMNDRGITKAVRQLQGAMRDAYWSKKPSRGEETTEAEWSAFYAWEAQAWAYLQSNYNDKY